MHLLKQSTAATVIVGPVLDASGAAVTTAVVGDFRLAKEGSSAVLSGATVTHDANGYYLIALTATNTNTVGRLAIYSNNTAQSMGTTRFMVLLPSVYDALVTNAVNATGGLPTATASITALAGAISTYSGGAVASVTGNVGGNVAGSVNSVVNRVTANTDQWGGVTVTGMPMPTYTQPAGFLGATFPATVASTTNITQASGVVLAPVTHTGARIPNVTLVDTTTVNTDMRGTDNALLAANYTAPPSAATNATAVRSELSVELARIDATVSSRLAAVTYVAPDNATIGTIATNLGTVNDNVLSRLAANAYTAPLTTAGTAAAVWNALLTTYTTAGSFGARVMRTDAASSGNGAKVTGAGHVASDLHELQPAVITSAAFAADWLTAAGIAADAVNEIQSGLATSANQVILIDRVSYALTALVGACSDAQTAAETYTLSIGGNTFTVDYSGLDASGNRSVTTLTKV